MMPLLFALVSTQQSKQFRGSSALVNTCSRIWTTFTSCPHLTGSEQSTPFRNMSCESACLGAKRKSPRFRVCNKNQNLRARVCFRHPERTIAEHAVLLKRGSVNARRPSLRGRGLQPSLSEEFARSHGASMWWCLCSILQILVDQCNKGVRHTAALTLILGSLRLHAQVRCLPGESADCLPMAHPDLAIQLAIHFKGLPHTPCLNEAAAIPLTLSAVCFAVPTWRELMLEHVHRPENPIVTNQGPSVLRAT